MKQLLKEIEKLTTTNKLLVETNERLIQANMQALNLSKSYLESNKQLLAQCGKIYKYLDSKNEKPWEEKESLDILYSLITHSKI